MTWEERMAQRAAVRAEDERCRLQAEQEAAWAAEPDWQDDPTWQAWIAAARPMTEDEALDLITHGTPPCACAGGPGCCMVRMEVARRLLAPPF